MPKYLVDENLPGNLRIWSSSDFVHTNNIQSLSTDSDIWQYAFNNSLIILTKDTDFYYRHLSGTNSPKVIWFRTGNMTKIILEKFITEMWKEIEELISEEHFLIIYREYIEVV